MIRLLTVLFFIPLFVLSQTFESSFHRYFHDMGFSVEQLNNGGYIILGSSSNSNSTESDNDVWIIKTNENGEEIWNKTFDTGYCEQGNWIKEINNNELIIFGYRIPINSNGTFDDVGRGFIIKTDSEGNQIWENILPTGLWSGDLINDGGYITTGGIQDLDNDFGLIKLDSNGDIIWNQIYNEWSESYYAISNSRVKQSSDGSYISIGTFTDNSYNNNLILLKTNSIGEPIWSQLFPYVSGGCDLDFSNDGGFILLGSGEDSNQESDILLIKTTNQGVEEWVKQYDNGWREFANDIEQTSDGGYIILGHKLEDSLIPGEDHQQKIWLIKTDVNGVLVWSQTFENDWGLIDGRDIEQTSDGGYIIVGTEPNETSYDIILIKTDSEGNINFTSIVEQINSTSNKSLIKTLDVLGRETQKSPYTPLIEIYDDGSVEKKIIIE